MDLKELNSKSRFSSRAENYDKYRSSYPNENEINFVPMISELEDLFNQYNNNGKVVLEYETRFYYCKMKNYLENKT